MTEEKVKVKIRKPKTRKGKAHLQAREPKEVEDVKKALLIYGPRTSQVLKDAMTEFSKLKWMECKRYTYLHPDVRPFEAGCELQLQKYCSKFDLGLFVIGSHSKKRPHNLVFGRTFDSQLYDMLELGIEQFQPMKAFKNAGSVTGGKPMFAFVGEKFETSPKLRAMKSLFLDYFRGREITNIMAKGLDRVILVVAVTEEKVLFRQFKCELKKREDGRSGAKVELDEMGPRLDLAVRRFRPAPEELEKESMKEPVKKAKAKNVKMNLLDGKVGRVYLPKQDVDSIVLAKPKGVKRRRGTGEDGEKKKKAKPTS